MAKLTADHTYSDQELLDLAREAMARIVAGAVETWIGQERYRKADLPQLRAYISELESKIEAASNPGGMSIVRGTYRSI